MATQPGRQSAAAQSVLSAVPVGLKQRAEVPVAFRDNSPEAEMWRSIVSAEAAEWFHAGDLPLLEAFCKAAVHYRRVTVICETAAYVIESAHGGQTINPIFKLQDLLAKQMAGLAGKLRLAQSTRVSNHQAASTAKKSASGAKPWERAA